MRLLSGGISAEKTSSPSSTLLPVRLRWATRTHNTQALLDSGAEGNFMDFKLALKLRIPITSLTHQISVNALNGQELHLLNPSHLSHLAITLRSYHSSSWTHHWHRWFWDTHGSRFTTLGSTGAIILFPHGVTTVMSFV